MITEVFFDVETKKLFADIGSWDPSALGVSIVSVLQRRLNEAHLVTHEKLISFWEKDFPDMWQLFEGANRVIGFNSKRFDLAVLAPIAPKWFLTLPHFDMMEILRNKLGRRISLNTLARDTLGYQKNDQSFNAVVYWNRGDPDSLKRLKEYCEMDVQITRELYDFGVIHGHLKYLDKWNNLKTVTVDFSYPKTSSNSPQIKLF